MNQISKSKRADGNLHGNLQRSGTSKTKKICNAESTSHDDIVTYPAGPEESIISEITLEERLISEINVYLAGFSPKNLTRMLSFTKGLHRGQLREARQIRKAQINQDG